MNEETHIYRSLEPDAYPAAPFCGREKTSKYATLLSWLDSCRTPEQIDLCEKAARHLLPAHEYHTFCLKADTKRDLPSTNCLAWDESTK